MTDKNLSNKKSEELTTPAVQPDLKRGIGVIKSTAKKLTAQPGVYRMLDHEGNAPLCRQGKIPK